MGTMRGWRGGLFAGAKPKALEPKEAEVQKSIRSFLDLLGIYNDRLNAGMVNVVTKYTKKDGTEREYSKWIQLCKKGTPDLFFIFNGRIHFVETKTRDGLLKPEQFDRQKELRRSGAVVWVARSVDSFTEQFYGQYPLLKQIA